MKTSEKIDKFEQGVKDLIERLREYNETDAGFLSISNFDLSGQFEYDFDEMEGSVELNLTPETPADEVEITMDLSENDQDF